MDGLLDFLDVDSEADPAGGGDAVNVQATEPSPAVTNLPAVIPREDGFEIGSAVIVDDSTQPLPWDNSSFDQGGRVGVDPETNGWFFLQLLQVPDAGRYPSPVEAGVEFVEIDLGGIETCATAAVVRKIKPTLPDSQLAAIEQIELRRSKETNKPPRRGVMKAIEDERHRRGPAVEKWQKRGTTETIRGQIAGAVFAVGDSEPDVLLVGRDGREPEVIGQVFESFRAGANTSGWSSGWAGFDVVRQIRLLRLRALFHDCPQRFDGGFLHQQTWFTDEPLTEAAAALGLQFGDLLSDVELFEAVSQCRWPVVNREMVRRFQMSRCVLLAERSI